MSDILMKGTEPIGQVCDITADNVEYSSGVSVKDKIDKNGTINTATSNQGDNAKAYFIHSGRIVTYHAKIVKTINSYTIFTGFPVSYNGDETILNYVDISGTRYPIILTSAGQFQIRMINTFDTPIYIDGSYLANVNN